MNILLLGGSVGPPPPQPRFIDSGRKHQGHSLPTHGLIAAREEGKRRHSINEVIGIMRVDWGGGAKEGGEWLSELY